MKLNKNIQYKFILRGPLNRGLRGVGTAPQRSDWPAARSREGRKTKCKTKSRGREGRGRGAGRPSTYKCTSREGAAAQRPDNALTLKLTEQSMTSIKVTLTINIRY